MLSKIVIATDFSEEAEIAVVQGMRVAGLLGAEVMLVHACNVVQPLPPAMVSGSTEEFRQMARENLVAATARLEERARELSKGGTRVTAQCVEGFPDTRVCEVAAELGADLIISGTHGRTGVRRFFLGSIAERIVRLANTNTMTARRGDSEILEGGFKRILIPTDFSGTSKGAFPLAVPLAAEDATVEVLHVMQSQVYPLLPTGNPLFTKYAEVERLWKEALGQAEQQYWELLEQRGRAGVKLVCTLEHGSPAAGIAKRLDDSVYDLVVMGSHGHRGVRRALLGSVAESVVRHAPCSVVVIRE